jgi:cell shape-determining protein MreC
MFTWCTILFLLGITAFLDSMFNYGEIFRQINSVLFMLVSLGLLIRTTLKARAQVFEQQVQRISELERQITELQAQVDQLLPVGAPSVKVG